MLEYWYDALRSKHGISVNVTNQELAKAKLYAARKQAQDPKLDSITIRVPPNDPTKLWLVHNGKEKGTVRPGEGDSEAVRGGLPQTPGVIPADRSEQDN